MRALEVSFFQTLRLCEYRLVGHFGVALAAQVLNPAPMDKDTWNCLIGMVCWFSFQLGGFNSPTRSVHSPHVPVPPNCSAWDRASRRLQRIRVQQTWDPRFGIFQSSSRFDALPLTWDVG